ncbi:MAG TPA: protein translocase subunit SecD [Elusimicrobia bacterium]|nr:MAG: protein-export membrane protein SecD [Elusimicrobia bacterium GWA2_66_18]HAZ08769.1 protein translocase subunit SecD [Elusimicrobiota bacterium]
MSKTQTKWIGLLALVVGALFMLYPSINWYSLDAVERAKLEALRERPKYLVNLGLDLKGGTHMVMELEVDKLDAKTPLNDAMSQAIEILRNRIDQFGVAEPLIVRQGARWIVVQLPGVTDSVHAKELVGKTAMLEFRMVDDTEKGRTELNKILELGNPFDANGVVSPAAAKLVPEGLVLFKGKDSAMYLLQKESPLTGASLETAKVETGGEYGLPVVAFKFKPEAAGKFAALTAANVNKHMAIVLDGIVYSAPVIKGRISGGSGIIEGQFTPEDAKSLAIVLRAGALPAPVKVIEERVVGPTVGEDSIKDGVRSGAIGFILVVLFIIIYYRASGLVAVIALGLNLVLLVAIMAYLRSTLTLPGMAGIILSLAMAVDANVLIFERIREELRLGKPVKTALSVGYDRAFSAILDSHMTSLISSVFLFQFGTGPIKGFAVTLTIGLILSLFTAIVITRMIFDYYLENNEVEELSI